MGKILGPNRAEPSAEPREKQGPPELSEFYHAVPECLAFLPRFLLFSEIGKRPVVETKQGAPTD